MTFFSFNRYFAVIIENGMIFCGFKLQIHQKGYKICAEI